MLGWLIVLASLIIYILILYWLHKRGSLKGERFALYGPFLMIKTQKGKGLIDRIARRKRFWTHFGTFSIGVCLLLMILITVLLLWSASLVFMIPEGSEPTPEMLIGIPGVNPFIPLWYGILALIVAIVVHEFAHGILARAANMKVKSLGLLFFVIPLGAFVEPDEDEIRSVQPRKRMRLFAAGATVNILVALICAIIFSVVFMGSVTSVHEGAGIINVQSGTPAAIDLEEGMIITNMEFEREGARIVHVWEDTPASTNLIAGFTIVSLNDANISSRQDFSNAMDNVQAGQVVNISVYSNGTIENRTVIMANRFDITGDQADDGKGYLGVSVVDSDITITGPADFSIVMGSTWANETVNITVYRNGGYEVHSVMLGDKIIFTERQGDDGRGYLGVLTISTDTSVYHPLQPEPGSNDLFQSGLAYISLPLIQRSPIQEPITDFYEISGPLAAIPESAFWTMANIFYWIFWINLMLGATNALPAVPLDGGYIFKDALGGLLRRIRPGMEDKKRDKLVGRISLGLALLILFLIIWTLVGPRIL
jgi:membrane-associated protease RseP (regulator of RpoE activity)